MHARHFGTALLALSCAAATPVVAGDCAPPGAVISGGIGDSAQRQLLDQQARYDLKLVFTLIEGNYLSDVEVEIAGDGKLPTIRLQTGGPFLLACLPAGRYTVSVEHGGKRQSRKIAVGKGLRTEYFRWPADPAADFALPPQHRGDGG